MPPRPLARLRSPRAVALLLLAGCAGGTHTVPVDLLQPAAAPVTNLRRLALLTLADAPGSTGSGKAMTGALTTRFTADSPVRLVERSRIDEVLRESELSARGVLSEEAAVTVGRLLGVDALLAGEVVSYDVETRERSEWRGEKVEVKDEKEKESEKGKNKRTVKRSESTWHEVKVREKLGLVEVAWRLVDPETGAVIASGTADADGRWASEDGEVVAAAALVEGPWWARAIGWMAAGGGLFSDELPQNAEILSRLSEKVCREIVAQVAPHRVARARKIEKGETPSCREGFELAKRGRWDDALEVWEKAASVDTPDAALFNNLAVAYERSGAAEKARAAYRRAADLDPDRDRYREALLDLGPESAPPARVFEVLSAPSADRWYVDFGADAGARAGDLLSAYEEVEVRRQDTQEVVGVDRVELGVLRVVEVFPRMSAAVVEEGREGRAIRPGARVVPLEDPEPWGRDDDTGK